MPKLENIEALTFTLCFVLTGFLSLAAIPLA
jgi:hypothetical protein